LNGDPIGIVESLEVELSELELSKESEEEVTESNEERPGILDEKVTHEDNTKIGSSKK
jgi:hypothetical protein